MSDTSKPHPMIEAVGQTAAAADKVSLRHDIVVAFGGAEAVDMLSQAWGGALQNPKAAPGWKTTKEHAEAIAALPVASIAIDADGNGAIAMALPESSKAGISAFLAELEQLAEASGSSPASIAKASKAFSEQAQKWDFAKSFAKDDASLVCSEFLSAGGDAFLRFDLDNFGPVTSAQILEMATTPPGSDPDMDASGARKYRSLGQMVKAGDAAALSEAVASFRKGGPLVDTQKHMLAQLLWHAAELGHLDVVRVLVEEGEANPAIRDQNGLTPLLIASFKGHDKIIDFLVNHGCDIDEPSVDGKTALMFAAELDKPEVIRLLISRGAELDAITLDGRTALHFACMGAEEKTSSAAVEALMEAKANPAIADMIENAFPEQLVDEESDATYSALVEYRKNWESGNVARPSQPLASKVRP